LLDLAQITSNFVCLVFYRITKKKTRKIHAESSFRVKYIRRWKYAKFFRRS